MSPAYARAAGLVAAAVVVFGSGIWLTAVGRPYSTAVTTVHKLVDLAAVIVIGVMVYQANRAAPLSALEWTVIGAAAVLVVATFASGGVVSASSDPPAWAVLVHRVAPWLAGIAAGAGVYLVSAH